MEDATTMGRLLTVEEIARLTKLGYGVGWDEDDPDKTQFNHAVNLVNGAALCGSGRLWFFGAPFWSERGDQSWVDEDRRLRCVDCLRRLPALLGVGDNDASR